MEPPNREKLLILLNALSKLAESYRGLQKVYLDSSVSSTKFANTLETFTKQRPPAHPKLSSI